MLKSLKAFSGSNFILVKAASRISEREESLARFFKQVIRGLAVSSIPLYAHYLVLWAK